MNSLSHVFEQPTQHPIYINPTPFQQLVNRLVTVKYDQNDMLDIIFDFFSVYKPGLIDFKRSPDSYSRTILYRDKSGFEIMVARWDKDARTPVHGHPRFALFYVIQGKLKETLFSKDRDRVAEELTTIHHTGDYTYHQGVEGRFDNSIHRISAVAESLSLHIYSDDALKGEVF